MQVTTRLLMAHTRAVRAQSALSSVDAAVKAASDMILPPIKLYRELLRAHRRLSPELRALGDDYIKSEFRRHQKVDNPLHIVSFCKEWKMYLDALHADSGEPGGPRGRALDPSLIDRFSDEQLYQLYELKVAAEEAFDTEHSQVLSDKNK